MITPGIRRLLLFSGFMFLFAGCASLDVTTRKALTPATAKQGVTLGIQAAGDRLQDIVNDPENSLINAASGKLFDKVTLLPKDSKFMQHQQIQSTYKVDYILAIGISDINVNANLNPYWFATLPLLFLNPFIKTYTPMVTFEPGVSLDINLRDAASGATLLQKQVMESSSDHYSPTNPGPKVRKLVSMTINNALVDVFRDAQQIIAAARTGTK